MKILIHAILTALVVLATPTLTARAQTIVSVHPRAAYVRTNQDASVDAVPISLVTIGVLPGERLRIRALGEYAYNSSGSTTKGTGAVFSSSSTLLASTAAHRVPGALDAGEDWVTGPTFFGTLATDIPEDFHVALLGGPDYVVVRVPLGSTHIFACPVDSLFQDNSDTDANYAVEFTPIPCVADVDDGSGTGSPDNGVTIDDLLYYLGQFEAGDAAADVDDGSGTGTPDGGVTIDDLIYYLTRFEAGC